MLHRKFGLDWQSGFIEADLRNSIAIYMFIVPGCGQTKPWGLHAKFQNHRPSGSGEEDI